MIALAVVASLGGLLLVLPPRPRLEAVAGPEVSPRAGPRRLRWLWASLAGLGAGGFVAGPWWPVAAVTVAVATWVVLSRVEDPRDRREREAAAHDLGHLVGLLAAALRSGAAPVGALAVVCGALPGPAAERLAGARRLLELGATPERAWTEVARDPVLAPLGRALERAAVTGMPVAATLERLAEDLAAQARAGVEDRARAVGVRAAVPLGLCLLPAFLVLGVVPVVAALVGDLLG